MTVFNYYSDHIPVLWCILVIYKINVDIIPQSPALLIVCMETLMAVLTCCGGNQYARMTRAAHCEKSEGVVTTKFSGIALGTSYYFNVNWSPRGSCYLGVSRYGKNVDLTDVTLTMFSPNSPVSG